MTKEMIKHLKEMVEIQGREGTYNYSEYMLGMYNGMELMLATVEGRNPNYKYVRTEDFLCKQELPIN